MPTSFTIIILLAAAVTPSREVNVSTADELTAAAVVGGSRIHLAPGRYALGPETLRLPENTRLEGAGPATILIAAKGTRQLLSMASGTCLRDCVIEAGDSEPGPIQEGLIITPQGAKGVSIQGVQVTGSRRVSIIADNATDFLVADCVFTDVYAGIHATFSNHVRITGNTIRKARHSGIQIWGNWKWESRRSADVLVRDNIVEDVGVLEGEPGEFDANSGGAIWAAGVERVVFSGNIVRRATDVCLDLEWCRDSVISGNIAQGAKNACISLFFSCDNIAITGNTVLNDWPNEKDTPEGWWSRAGIWLTPTNTKDFPGDTGHQRVIITGNTIACPEGQQRRGIWLPEAVLKDVSVTANQMSGGALWRGDVKSD